MTKTERLWSLMTYIKENRAVSVSEMAEHFKVSHRTIYRDLNTLTKMNVRIEFDNGFKLARDTTSGPADLSADELELTMFCLENNPLVGEPYFDERLAAIREVLSRVRQKQEHVQVERLILGDRNPRIATNPDGREVLDRFVDAVLKRRKVRVNVLHSWQEGLFIPLSIKVRTDGIRLMMTRESSGQAMEFALSEVTQVTIASEKFDRRPVELLMAAANDEP